MCERNIAVQTERRSELEQQQCDSGGIAMIFDARGNGGGTISPTITGDHQNRITDYTAIVVTYEDENRVLRQAEI